MEFRLLGWVEVYAGKQRLDVGPRLQRLILGVLALEVNQPVPLDRLVELGWPASPRRTPSWWVSPSFGRRSRRPVWREDAELARKGSGSVLRAHPDTENVRAKLGLPSAQRRQ